jgi:hypothetical protein
MLAEKLLGWSVTVIFVVPTLLSAQTSFPVKSTVPAQPPIGTAQKQPTLAEYQNLLSDTDVVGDPDVLKAIYAKWVDLSCKQKQAKLAAVGITDSVVRNEVYAACSTRLLVQAPVVAVKIVPTAQPSGTSPNQNPPTAPVTSPGANTALKPPAAALSQDQLNALDAAVGALVVPSSCSVLPSPSKKIDPALQSVSNMSPIKMEVASVPKAWLQLNANSSGGEHQTKSTVWVGYVNRLRYTATLGGVVTSIAAPTLPNNIFPSPAVAPANKAAPSTSGGPLPSASTTNFNRLNKCIGDIQQETVAFQQNLGGFETSLNAARIRIGAKLAALPPIANTTAEARSSADLTLFPATIIPPFPLAEVIALHGLLTEVQTEYLQIAQWASTSASISNVYAAESASLTALNKVLDAYLSPSSSAAPQVPPAGSSSAHLVAPVTTLPAAHPVQGTVQPSPGAPAVAAGQVGTAPANPATGNPIPIATPTPDTSVSGGLAAKLHR